MIRGPIILSAEPLETITNPAVLVEVLSPSTRAYDRGAKFELYRSIPTFRDYLLIEQSAPPGVIRVTILKLAKGWAYGRRSCFG